MRNGSPPRTSSRAGIGRLLATAEAYPDLKASASYLELQRRISGLEEQIAHRREYYNAAVNLNNVRMEQFPDLLLVGLAGLSHSVRCSPRRRRSRPT